MNRPAGGVTGRALRPTIACLAWLGLVAALQAAELKTAEVEYEAGGTIMRGFLAYDAEVKGPRPGVLVVHEWWGLNEHARSKARALAEAGYLALAVDMYGGGKNTTHVGEAGEWSAYVRQRLGIAEARFSAAQDLLKGHELVSGSKIGAIGFCFGGYTVLHMAMRGHDLQGVVSFHGALPDIAAEPGSVRAKLLVLHGAEDGLVAPQLEPFLGRIREAEADWQLITYGGARHSFTNPDAALAGIEALAYDEKTDRRSWRSTLAFLEEVFGE